MNIHEYQAKELFGQYGVASERGVAVQDPSEIGPALERICVDSIVVKAQIHAGGRGKGTFTDGYKGGVKLANTCCEGAEMARRMLGNTLITKQTGPAGRVVRTVFFTEAHQIKKEYYLAILMDRETSNPIIIASTEGGVEIEKVAAETPEKIIRVPVDAGIGLQPYQCRRVSFGLGLEGDLVKQADKLLNGLYRLFIEKDCSMVEVNPLVVNEKGELQALDAKVNFDDNALFRHPEIVALRDLNEEDPREVEASKWGLSYIALDGNIACLVNGAGLAMATMDIIKHFGGNPSNFLDVGGGATTEQVTEAFRIILSDKKVKGILVNIFGGIMSCATIAKGVTAAAKAVGISIPLVIRLEGSEVNEGKQILKESGIAHDSADSLSDAARKIVERVKAQEA